MNKGNDMNQRKREFRIDDMFGEIYETETMSFEDGRDLLQETISDGEKERIMGLVYEKMGENRTVRSKGKKRRVLMAALIAVFAFASTAFAAEIFQWDTRISNYLGIGERDLEELSGGGMNVGVSAENDGVEIKAVQTIGDANNIYILLDITAPEGTVIDPNTRFDMIYLQVEGAQSLGYSCDMVPDGNDLDNKATMMISMDANNKINNKIINLKFKDMGHYIQGSGEVVSDFNGEWELNWKLDYQDISKKYKIGKELEVRGETVRVDSASISPIALNIALSGDFFREYDSIPPVPGEGDLIELKAVKFKDGSILTQEDASSWGTSIHGSEYVINMKMKQLIDADQIQSITLNDTEIDLADN